MENEIVEFRKTMQTKSAEQVYNTAFRIHFYEEVWYFFSEEGDRWLSGRTIDALEKFSKEHTGEVMAILYDAFINSDNSSCDSWEYIVDFLEALF